MLKNASKRGVQGGLPLQKKKLKKCFTAKYTFTPLVAKFTANDEIRHLRSIFHFYRKVHIYPLHHLDLYGGSAQWRGRG